MKTRQAKRKERRGPQRLANLAAAALLAAALAGVWVLRLPEPVYQGIPLSAWMEDLGDNPYAAGRALREIGPGAVLPLVRALERKPAGWLSAYAVVVGHAPRFLKSPLADSYAGIARRELQIPRIRAAAARILGDFGPAAEEAVRALMKISEPSNGNADAA